MRSRPFRVPHCDYDGEAFSVPALSAPPNSPGSGRETVCNRPRSDRRESRASRDGNSGDQDRAADRSAGFGWQRSEPVPVAPSIDRVRRHPGCAAIRGGRFLRSGAATNPGKDGIPDSKECGEGGLTFAGVTCMLAGRDLCRPKACPHTATARNINRKTRPVLHFTKWPQIPCRKCKRLV